MIHIGKVEFFILSAKELRKYTPPLIVPPPSNNLLSFLYLQSFVESCFNNKYDQAQTLSNFLQQCTAVQTSITYFHKTSTVGRFIDWSTSIQRAISSTRVLYMAWRMLETRALGTLTLWQPSHPLQTTSKSVKFETLKPRCFLFHISVWKDFHPKAQYSK